MRSILGLLQIGCIIGGIVAIFSGQWLLLIGAFVVAGVVGFAGNRLIGAAEGVSETGREAVGNINQAIALLRRGEFEAATGMTRSAVTSARMGGDKNLLPIVLTLHAVALAATRDTAGSEKALVDATSSARTLPPVLAADFAEITQVHDLVRRELANGVPDPHRLVAAFIAFNDGH